MFQATNGGVAATMTRLFITRKHLPFVVMFSDVKKGVRVDVWMLVPARAVTFRSEGTLVRSSVAVIRNSPLSAERKGSFQWNPSTRCEVFVPGLHHGRLVNE